MNVDTIVKYYDNFIASGSLTSNNNSSDNLTNGFIQIGEQTSSKKEQGITFKNFKKQDGIVTFNYEALSSTKPKNIYIELYDASKNLLYTEIFSVTSVEKDSLAQYSVKVPSDVYDTVSYANVKTINATIPSTLTCKKSDDDYDYKNVYNFNSDSLASYEVTKVERSENANLQTEFDNLDKSLNATYQDKILKYSVDLETTTTKVLFQKGLSSYAIKNNQEAIDWKCE